jgi:hypothetical protein
MKRVCRRLFWSSPVPPVSREEEFLFLGNKGLMEKLAGLQSRHVAIEAKLDETLQHEVVVKLKREQSELSKTVLLVETLLGLEKAFDECEQLERAPDQDIDLLKFVAEEKTRLQGEIMSVEQVSLHVFFLCVLVGQTSVFKKGSGGSRAASK